jgi:hypothetical protein
MHKNLTKIFASEEFLMRLTKMVSVLILVLVQFSFSGFDPCKFNFGIAWNGSGKDYSEVDYITIWAGKDNDFNNNWIGAMLELCKSSNKTPVLYSSIIAYTARNDLGLKDCSVGTPNLCEQGANFIRTKKSRIMEQYDKYIMGVKTKFGTIDPIIWLMEPDYYQYCEGNQDGGVLSGQDAGQLMHGLAAKIKATLPNAVISMDISPWVQNQSGWFGNFQMDDFTYMNTSGGQTDAQSNSIRGSNPTTWKGIHDLTTKCIIADDGYATSGSSSGHDPTWDDVNNLKNRMSDGVIAITQANPKSDWATTIKTIRSQLGKPVCPCLNLIKTKFSLSLTTTGSGTVSITPADSSFDSGTTVTLTALPSSEETFNGWSGALSGSAAAQTIIMNSNKTVAAAFSSNKPMNYSLTIKTKGSGTVSVSPQANTYVSGTSVTLTATPGTGATFTGWSGALSGATSPATLEITSNLTVTATFLGGIVTGNLVKNGDFTLNADNWNLGTYESGKATGGQSSGKYTVTTQTVGGSAWNIQFSQSGVKLEKDKDYSFSFSASAQSNTTLMVNIGMAGSPYTSFTTEQTVNLTTHDSLYVIAFTMKEASTSDARVEFNGGKTSGTWSIDNIVLIDPTEVSVKNSQHFIIPKTGPLTSVIEKNAFAKMTVYDQTGRVIRDVSGIYGVLSLSSQINKPGMYIFVVKSGGKRIVEKHLILNR